jgi:hypothetical protein
MVRIRDDLLANTVVLQIIPDIFVWIKFRGVRRQQKQSELALSGIDELAYQFRFVSGKPIDDQKNRIIHPVEETVQKGHKHLRVDSFTHTPKTEIASPTYSRDDDSQCCRHELPEAAQVGSTFVAPTSVWKLSDQGLPACIEFKRNKAFSGPTTLLGQVDPVAHDYWPLPY